MVTLQPKEGAEPEVFGEVNMSQLVGHRIFLQTNLTGITPGDLKYIDFCRCKRINYFQEIEIF